MYFCQIWPPWQCPNVVDLQVHACFVSDDFVSARTNIKNSKQAINRSKCCRCFKGMGADRTVLDVGPSPGVLAELRKLDRVACMKVKHRVSQAGEGRLNLTLRNITIWMSKYCQKLEVFFKKLKKIVIFFQQNCQWQFCYKKWQFFQFFWKKCQVFGNFLTFKWQYSGGSVVNP